MNDRKQHWNQRYVDGDLPWDHAPHDGNLVSLIEEWPIAPCCALDIGCGTGTNAIWLAQQGFDVTAVELAPEALATARAKAERAGVQVIFGETDMCEAAPTGGPYDLVFDRGCFHSVGAGQNRDTFARHVHACLVAGGLWFSLIGSTDAPPRDVGPPQLTARQVVGHIEPWFEILMLKATHFDSHQEHAAPAWACLGRARVL